MAVNEIVVVNTTNNVTVVDEVVSQTVVETTETKLVSVLAGQKGDAGPAPTLSGVVVTTGAAGSSGSGNITGSNPYTINLTIPRGDTGATGATGATGPTGPAPTLSSVIVTTGAAGSAGSGSWSGTNPYTLNLTIPRGDTGATGPTGPAPTLNQPVVTQLAIGSTPTASFTGTNPYTLNLGIPIGSAWLDGTAPPPTGSGNVGDYYLVSSGTGLGDVYKKTGATTWSPSGNIRGATGTGDLTGPASSVTNQLAIFSGTTGKAITNSSILSTDITTLSGNQTISGVKTFTNQPVLSSGLTSTGTIIDWNNNAGSSLWSKYAQNVARLSSSSSAETGWLVITVPLTYLTSGSRMLHLRLHGHVHTTGLGDVDLRFRFYNYASGISATTTTNHSVFGVSAVQYLYRTSDSMVTIAVQASAASWAYPKLWLDVKAGHSTMLADSFFQSGWDMQFVPDLTAYTFVNSQTVKQVILDDGAGNISATGTITSGGTGFAGPGANITTLNGTNITTGTVADARLSTNVALLTGTQTFSGAKTFSSLVTASAGVTVTGTVTATSFSGSGASLTSLTAANINGVIPIANIPTGTTGTTVALGNHTHAGVYEPVITAGTTAQYYRGDKTWATLDKTAVGLSNVLNVDTTNLSNATAGTIPDARLPVRLMATASSITDWNLANETGFWRNAAGSALNAPDTSFYSGYVVKTTARIFQTIWEATSSSTDTKMWSRQYDGTSWSAWFRVRQSEAELDTRYAQVANAVLLAGVQTLTGTKTFDAQTFFNKGVFLKDATDNTKGVTFDISGVSTGTTRTITIPNFGGVLVLEGGTQTISGAKTFSSVITGSAGINVASGQNINLGVSGQGAPTFTTYSAGTKIILWDSIGASSAGYAIGMESGTLWNSVGSTANQFKWYGGTTLAATLTGAGNLSTTGTITSGGAIFATSLQVIASGNAQVELGRTDGTSSVPYIDFHSGATAVDYDSRIQASGGNGTNGAGVITITAQGGLVLNGGFSASGPVTTTVSANSLNTQRFIFTVATAARPTGTAYVEWVGPVQPNNWISGDTWVNTA